MSSGALLRVGAKGLVVVDVSRIGGYAALMAETRRIAEASGLPLRAAVLTGAEPGRAGIVAQLLDAGVPVITINSGIDDWQDFGAITHVGQSETIAGETAGEQLTEAGLQNVWQLEGGILKYFEEAGGAHFQGTCFVFDKREALDPTLQPASTSSRA